VKKQNILRRSALLRATALVPAFLIMQLGQTALAEEREPDSTWTQQAKGSTDPAAPCQQSFASIACGEGAVASNDGTQGTMAIGQDANALGSGAIAIGPDAEAQSGSVLSVRQQVP
jgi:hypothetical protein